MQVSDTAISQYQMASALPFPGTLKLMQDGLSPVAFPWTLGKAFLAAFRRSQESGLVMGLC
jgi:hypothetical protein